MSQADTEVNEIVSLVLEMAVEPSYLSEIVRKVNKNIPAQSLSVSQVAQVASMVSDRDGVELETVGYGRNEGQSIGSPHNSLADDSGDGTTKWEEYTIIHNKDTQASDVRDEVRDIIDPTVTVREKSKVVDTLSGEGNSVSRQAEEIFQAVMSRQFRAYDITESGGYNDPGIDFIASDTTQRGYTLALEVSVRYENPVDRPYIEAKKESAFDIDADLLVMAPRFTDNMRSKHEPIDDGEWHSSPEGEIVHLHRVPSETPEVYRPFAEAVPPEYERDDDGFPVILPDNARTREVLGEGDKVGGPYPVVDGNKPSFRSALDSVAREYDGISESGYRTQLREAMEPLLHEFARPYRIEQFLVDSYWDKGFTQGEIGRLTGVSDRTISEWMSDNKWNIATRGTNTRIEQDTIEIWKAMYRGEAPFPREMTGYEIQSLYNRHPEYSLSDWRQWYALSDRTRARIMEATTSPEDKASYTVMLNDGERLFPSYDFIINTLRRNGVDIRDSFFNETGTVYPTGLALEFMLNRNINTLGRDREPGQTDVTEMRSGLEVQVAEHFSENEVPFAYEPFKIPSSFGGRTDSIGSGDSLVDSLRDDTTSETWARIYRKHNLASAGPSDSEQVLESISRQEIVPDFALYPGTDPSPKDVDWAGWTNYSHIVEVAGPYGAPPPQGFQSWYRFRGVAEKELVYKLLGLWDKTYFVVTDDEDIPDDVRNDPHYLVVNPTARDAGVNGLLSFLGLR